MRRLAILLILLLLPAIPAHAATGYYALQFDGDDYITAQGISSNSLSVVVLFKATNLTGEHNLFDARKWGDSFGGWNLRVEAGAVKFITVWNDSGTYKEAGVSTSISASRAYLVAAVHDGAESRLYLDGQLAGSVQVDGLTENSEATLWIGENRAGSGFFEGTIYMILIYNRALSDSEIQAIYADPLNPPTDGLVLFYAPDSVDTVNGLWKDLSGNGNDGTIYGAEPVRVVLLTFNVYSVIGGAINATVTDLTESISAPAHLVFTRYSNEPHVFQVFADGFRSVRTVAVPNANKQFTVYLAPVVQASPEPPGEQIGELFVGNETDKGIIGDRTLAGFVALITVFGFLAIARVDGSTGAVIGTVLLIALSAGGYLPQSMLFISLFLAGGLTYYVVINATGIGRR